MLAPHLRSILGKLARLVYSVYTLLSSVANKNVVTLCRTYFSPWGVLLVQDIKTSIGCGHVMWRGKTLEGRHKLVLSLRECRHGHSNSMSRDGRLSAWWLYISSLQPVPWGVLPKSKLLPSIHEWHFLAKLRALPLKRFAAYWLWCLIFIFTDLVGWNAVLLVVVGLICLKGHY